MERRFTPGPWIIEMEPETWCDAGDDGRTIGGYTGEMEPTGAIYVENNDADGTVTYICDNAGVNLDLIAAAPELLEALEFCAKQMLLPLHEREESAAVAKAKAAINKAVPA